LPRWSQTSRNVVAIEDMPRFSLVSSDSGTGALRFAVIRLPQVGHFRFSVFSLDISFSFSFLRKLRQIDFSVEDTEDK
jgi:hypothetical protein